MTHIMFQAAADRSIVWPVADLSLHSHPDGSCFARSTDDPQTYWSITKDEFDRVAAELCKKKVSRNANTKKV